MLDEWLRSVLVLIFKENLHVRSCNAYRVAKLLEHAMKIVERVLKRRIQELVNVDGIQFSRGQQAHCLS